MIGYINKFNENKNKNKKKNKNTITMPLKVKDKKLFKNYNEIWTKIEKLMGKDFNTKPTYGNENKYIKTKIKTYEDNFIWTYELQISVIQKGLKKYQKKKYHINVYQ